MWDHESSELKMESNIKDISTESIFAIRGDMITLGQLLKVKDIAGSGAQVKDVLGSGGILVNDVVDCRRGRKLHAGDIIMVPGHAAIRLVSSE